MKNKKLVLPRRTLLRAAGLTLSLPFLEAMLPFSRPSQAADVGVKRYMAISIPNGIIDGDWHPNQQWLNPIRELRSKYSIFQGLQNERNEQGQSIMSDITHGEHCHGTACFLTGTGLLRGHTRENGWDINKVRNGKSVDQYISDHFYQSRGNRGIKDLHLARGAQYIDEDGYSKKYTSTLSWKGGSLSAEAISVDPIQALNELFKDGRPSSDPTKEPDQVVTDKELAKIKHTGLSRLDFFKSSLTRLKGQLGQQDKLRINEFETAVREAEKKVKALETTTVVPGREIASSCPELSVRNSNSFQQYTDTMFAIAALAFQCNQTQVITYLTNPSFSHAMVDIPGFSPQNIHSISHYNDQNASRLKPMLRRLYQLYIEKLTVFLKKIDGINEAGGSILDNSMILFGAGMGNGGLGAQRNAKDHRLYDLPILLAGGGGGTLKPGTDYNFSANNPENGPCLGSFHYTCMKKLGLPVTEFNGYKKTLTF